MNRLSRILLLISLVFVLVLAGCAGGGPAAGEDGGEAATEAPVDAQVITEDMAAAGVEMKLGSEAVIKFDPAYNWDIVATPTLVLDHVPDAVLNDGEQARLVAKLNGSAVIQATGRALCKQDNPPCDTPTKQLLIKVKVSP